jgi:hypothetical protein
MDFVIVAAVLALVVLFVSGPLRRTEGAAGSGAPAGADAGGVDPGSQLGELEAAREAKYREIRDAELDHRTGKLSDADYEAIDSALRGEAIEILRELDRARERGAAEAPAPAP